MEQHLEHLFGGFLDGCHDGLIEIAYTDNTDGKLKHARLFGTDELSEAAQFAYEQNQIPGRNVYVGAALRKAETARDRRANDHDILALTAFYTDLDDKDAATTAKQNYNGCPPTCVVVTGRQPHVRAQLWWRQETPAADLQEIRTQNIALAIAFGGDRVVANPSRVMRLAGSIAWPSKPDRVIERTELQLFDDKRPQAYPHGQLSRTFPPKIEAVNTAPPAKANTAPAANGQLNIGSASNLSIEACIAAIKSGQNWHSQALRLIGHWIARGWSDIEMLAACESFTLPGFTIEQTRREVEQMIIGARAKWSIPNPQHQAESFATIPLVAPFLSELNIAMLPRRHWILGRSLLRGQLSLLIAPPGVGKTTLGLAQAVAICTGQDLTSQEVYESGKVWLYNNEDDSDELKRRLAAVLLHHGITFPAIQNKLALSSGADRPFLIAKADRAGNVIRQPDVAACIEQIRQHRIKAFIVDPFIETHEVEENSNEQIKAVAQMYREIARQGDCAVMLVHHTAKPPQGSSDGHAGNMNTARGASSLIGVARIVQTLFGMSSRDADAFNIPDADRNQYVRLDDAKANLSLASPQALWYQRIGVTIANGDEVGVLAPIDLSETQTENATAESDLYKTIIANLLAQIPDNTVTLNNAAKTLAWGKNSQFAKYRQQDAKGYQRASHSLRDIIISACRANITITNEKGIQGFTIDTAKHPVQLTRFCTAINPLTQAEFMEDSDVGL